MEDVIVIGAGIVGTAAAYGLAKLGLRTRLVDNCPPGNGCSFGNAGLIAVDHVSPLASPDTIAGIPRMLMNADSPLKVHKRRVPRMAPWMLKFVSQSRPANFKRNTEALASIISVAAQAWHRLLDQGIAREFYRDIGSLYVFEQPVASEVQRRQIDLLQRYGVDFESLTAEQARERYLPKLTPNISHARYFPGMASVTNPFRVVQSLFEAALAGGATFTQAPASDIRLLADGRVSVRIGECEVFADKLLICAGAKSASLMHKFGVKVPLTKERGYHIQLTNPPCDTLKVPVSFVERGFTCNPMENGLRLAGTVELGASDEPDWRRADILATQFARLFPDAGAPQIATRWYGDRPTLPDYLPMIGELPSAPNVFVATGHQHLGLTLGPITGELVSQLIAREKPTIDLSPFRTDRF